MKRLLIIDEDTDVLDSMKLLLESYFQVCLARNGVEGLTEMDSGFIPDAILLDLAETAPAFLAELGRRGQKIPVLALTADPGAATRAQELGVDEVLRKPFTYEQLKEKLERLLKSPGGPRSGAGFLNGLTLVAV